MFHSFNFLKWYCALIVISGVILHTPAFADKYDPKWDAPREYYINLVETGCAGDQDALDKLYNDYASGDLSPEARSVAAHQVAWAYHPVNSCPPIRELQSEEKWRLWIRRAAVGGYPTSLYAVGRSLVEGTDGVTQDTVLGLQSLRMAEINGSSWAAQYLSRYHASGDYGLIPDRGTAWWYAFRAKQLGASGAAMDKTQEIVDNMRETGLTSDIILQLLQGRWAVEESGKPNDPIPFYFDFKGNALERNAERYETEGSFKAFPISIDPPECFQAGKAARLRYDDHCFEILVSGPNKVTLIPDSNEKGIFAPVEDIYTGLTLKRLY